VVLKLSQQCREEQKLLLLYFNFERNLNKILRFNQVLKSILLPKTSQVHDDAL
jgi:hypothetical protein